MSTSQAPVLVTGAAGRVGSVGRRVVEVLRASGLPVLALVRREDERAQRLRDLGAEVIVADLTKTEEVLPAVQGCRLVFFSTSVASDFLEASVVMAAAARTNPNLEILVNLSQMTVSSMDLTHVTESPQHRVHWLAEQVLNWSGVPVAHLRPTVFQESPFFWGLAAKSIEETGTIRLPFGKSRTNPVSANDVAEVGAAMLLEPSKYVGKAIDLTGPRAASVYDLAEEYSAALGRPVRYVEVPLDDWKKALESSKEVQIPEHVYRHIATMAKLHAAGDYDRTTDSVLEILGRPAASLSETIKAGRVPFVPFGPNLVS
ncbi:NAD(P)-binding protein [Aaosphaeria arxii CBS 175.79]|uniref:NAD(P)-binding protein n=1 Tax=Aaosphaeria arxii CBS 175.79 TaxID=1450172 RepID=A0A6A5XBV4_9PLEO|nr:NAD(P)-binding protein [Aaosphaeria arxii CBS 175.79]KAF2010264.1 NAD(P)-binding protein [Aaosphaeria arxii CBS 175.79]